MQRQILLLYVPRLPYPIPVAGIELLFRYCWGVQAQAGTFTFRNGSIHRFQPNPANTGFIPDADYRLGANYLWSSVMSGIQNIQCMGRC